jgi:LPXTG-motif cell wall-anchored protein
MGRRLLTLCGLWLLTLGLALPAAAQTGSARVRIIHAAPDTPPMDVFVGDQRVLSDVAYASISDYVDLPAGSQTLAVVPAGEDASAAVITEQLDLAAGQPYSVAVVGLADVEARVFEDDLSAPPAGQAKVRVLHFSPDAPGADVEVIDGPTLVQNLAFGEASPYLDVDATTYDLRLVTSGATTIIVQLPDTTFEADTIYDVAAVGRLANIQVVSATTTPSTQNEAAATPNEAVMPSTGASSTQWALLVLGLIAVGGGFALQRRAAPMK